MRIKRTLLTGLCGLALAVAMTACSSTTSTNASAASSGSSSPSGVPIKVGMICTCSGAGGFGSFVLPVKQVYQAWVKTVNKAGGIDGHPVQLIAKDDAGNPGTAATDAQTLISDHVVAIADASVADSAFASAVQSAGVPVVGVEPENAAFGTNPDFYPEGQTNASAVYAVLTTAKEAGATNLANIYCAESPACAQSVPYFESTGKKLGIPVTYNAQVSATAPNYTAQCVAAQQQHMTSVFIGDASAVIVKLATNCTQQGYKPVYVTEGEGFGMSEATGPGLKTLLWNAFPAIPFFAKTSAVKTANAAIAKYDPKLQSQSTYGEIAFMGWISGVLLEHAVKAGGLTAKATPTAAEVTKGLNSLKSDTLGGLTVPLTFTAGQPHNVNCWFTTRVQKGKPKLVNSGNYTCEKG